MRGVIWNRVKNPATFYVLVSLLVSFVGFVRAFLFMRSLGLVELGVLVFVQTIGQGIVMLQFGLINGGYRMFAGGDQGDQRQVNDFLFSVFGVLLLSLFLAWSLLAASGKVLSLSGPLLLAALLLGFVTLVANWLTNTLLGSRRIREINNINVLTMVTSVILLPVAYYGGLWGAVLGVTAQPLMFVLISLWRLPGLRPTGWLWDMALARRMLAVGFIPFVAGVFVLLNYQIERWSIASLLGKADLGRFYLVFLYATLFALVPGSVMSIFYPNALRAYQAGDLAGFRAIVRRHVLVVGGYALLVVAFSVIALPLMVALLFPAHTENVAYVYLFLPGLVALVLCDPATLIMNVTLRLRVMLWAGLCSVAILSGLIIAATMSGVFGLREMALIKSLVTICSFGIYWMYVARHRQALLYRP
jgi:O-antigen/teichoic acid export membrane protein